MKARAKSAGTMGSPARPPAPRPVSPGQPENALPRWYHLPLDAKIPLPRVVPKGKAVMYPAKAGEPLWRTPSESLGFDLNDPLLMQLPGPHEYNPLHDPFSSGHLRRPDLQDGLYCHGLVTRHGFCLTSLKNFNRFREYLHSINLRQLKRIKNEVEGQLRTEYENLALDVVREERQKEEELELETAAEGGTPLSARYSDIMRDEETKLPDHLPDFVSLLTNKEKEKLEEENKTFATIRFAKIQNRESRLAAVKGWLRKDGRKAALLRLRRLQIMEERRKKGINNWKTRTAVQSEFFEELKTRERRETEARRVHLAEKQRYQSAIGSVHDVKYNEIVRKWREERIQSVARLFCGYVEDFQTTFIKPEGYNGEEFADAEIQTDPQDGLDPKLDKGQILLFDRSTGLIHDITDGFNADEVREYEKAARQLVQSALFVHSEVILPATSRYKAELERGGGHDAAIQTSDSLQQMDPFVRQGSTKDLQGQDKSSHQTIGQPVKTGSGLVVTGDETNRSQSSADSSSHKTEVVFVTVENETLQAEKDDEQPNDKVELLTAAVDALEKLRAGAEDSLDLDAGKVERLLVRGRAVLAETISIRRNSSMVVEEIVRLAIDEIEKQLEETANSRQAEADGWKAENLSDKQRGQRRRRDRRSAIKKASSGSGIDFMTYIVGKAVAIANQSAELHHRSRERQSVDGPEVEHDGDEFTETFLKRIGEEEATRDRRRRWSALVSACDDFNDALCARYSRMDLSEGEIVKLTRDRIMNDANRLVTASIKKVVEDLEGEGLETSHPGSYVEATRAVAESMLNLALHRDLEEITKDYKEPRQIIDLVARIVRTHGSVRDSPAFGFTSAVGKNPLLTRWHLASILLNRLIAETLERATAEQSTCELTAEALISLAVAVDLRGLASDVVLVLPKKSRMRRRCPRQPPVIDQTKFRGAIIDSFGDKMKQLVGSAVLPDACVNNALFEAVQRATSTSSSVTSPKRLSQQTTALFADVKSIVADAATVVLHRTVGNLAAKFRATNDSQVESVLGQMENALMAIDAYGLVSTESQLGLKAKNSIVLSRERLKEISSSTHWSALGHSASDKEVDERVTRKMSVSGKVVRLSLSPTDPDLIHEPHLPPPESVDQGPMPQTASAIKASQPPPAVDTFLEELSVIPMFGSVPLDIDPNLVTEDLLVLSIKYDEDLDNPDLSMRNSFRNIHRPDVSSLRRFSSSSSSFSGPGSIHERVKDVFMQRRSIAEDESQIAAQRRIPITDEDSEYVISKVTVPETDSVPEFWPNEMGQSANDAPIHSTVTTEYSKQYSFPEDEKPESQSVQETFVKPDKAPDEISLASYFYGDPEEFHHLKISSSIIDDDESKHLLANGQANETPKKRNLPVSYSHIAEPEGKPYPLESSDELVIATREIFHSADLHHDASQEYSSQEPPKKRISDVEEEHPILLATGDDDVTLSLGAAAAALMKQDASSSSSKRRLDSSNASVALPPVPTNSLETGNDESTKITSTGSLDIVAKQPVGVVAYHDRKNRDDEGEFEQSNE